jgi:aminopeptidase N
VPWLDEGLTEFSMYYYFADRYGVPIGNALRRSRWETPVKVARSNKSDQPIGLPVKAYSNNYETMVYAKGALFFATLRDELGDDAFDKMLGRYVSEYRWQIATPEEFQALAEEASGKDLDPLFKQWLQGQ